ncbi:Mu-like prophage major head subunit gpT family protein [Citrobacter braakii]|uniref:Mu-like prophage major head subunit gpT family protein n=1 Tax=Citrobacter braakii TaxID=57706 RepID=UPI0035264113
MAIVTNALVQKLFIGFRKNFQDGLEVAESEYKKIATVVPSTTAQNIYAWLGHFPQMREWVGSRVIKSMKENGYAIRNKPYETTVGIPQSSIEDDTVGVYSPVFTEAGRAAAVYPDEHIFLLLKDGENALCYDGQNFFDNEHPVAANTDGTGAISLTSNIIDDPAYSGPAWYLMDTSRALKPLIFQERIKPDIRIKNNVDNSDHLFMEDEVLTGVRARSAVGFGFWQMAIKVKAELNSENYQAACKMLEEMQADGLRPLSFKASLIVVPPALKTAAKRVVKMEFISGSSNPNYNEADILSTAWVRE